MFPWSSKSSVLFWRPQRCSCVAGPCCPLDPSVVWTGDVQPGPYHSHPTKAGSANQTCRLLPPLLLITWSINVYHIIFGCSLLCAPHFLWLDFWGTQPACVTSGCFLNRQIYKWVTAEIPAYVTESRDLSLVENCLYLSRCNMFPLWYFERKHTAVVRRDVGLLTRWRWPDSL